MAGVEMKILYAPNQYSQQRQREKAAWIYPVHMAMEATKDIQDGHDVIWDPKSFTYDCRPGGDNYAEIITKPRYSDFLLLPIPDRRFTGAFDKRFQLYGNYKYHPATHMMAASGCWHGKCSFCVERKNTYQVRAIHNVIEEVKQCKKLGFKEIFDDSGTFPDGSWCENFCHWKMEEDLDDIVLGCNMRIGANVNFRLMKLAGFRMVLFGIESANQNTLDRLKKGIYAYDIIKTIREASRAGLEPHIAVMFGYSWETEEEEHRTLDLVHYLLKSGFAKTAQASTYSPTSSKPDSIHPFTRRIYDVAWSPEFWINKAKDIKNWRDFVYLLKGIKKGISHV